MRWRSLKPPMLVSRVGGPLPVDIRLGTLGGQRQDRVELLVELAQLAQLRPDYEVADYVASQPK
jgi:hypothetical protein